MAQSEEGIASPYTDSIDRETLLNASPFTGPDFKQVGPQLYVHMPTRLLIEEPTSRRRICPIPFLSNPVTKRVTGSNSSSFRRKMFPEFNWTVGVKDVWSPLYQDFDDFFEHRNFYVMKEPPESLVNALKTIKVTLCGDCRLFCCGPDGSTLMDNHVSNSSTCHGNWIGCRGFYSSHHKPKTYFIVVNGHVNDLISDKVKNSAQNDSKFEPLIEREPIITRKGRPNGTHSTPKNLKKGKTIAKREESLEIAIPDAPNFQVEFSNSSKLVSGMNEGEEVELSTTVCSSVETRMKEIEAHKRLPSVSDIILGLIDSDNSIAKRRLPRSLLEFFKDDLTTTQDTIVDITTKIRSLPAEMFLADSDGAIQMCVRIIKKAGRQLLFALVITVYLEHTTEPFSTDNTDKIEVPNLSLEQLCTALMVLSATTKDVFSRFKAGVNITRREFKEIVSRCLIERDLGQHCWQLVYHFLKAKSQCPIVEQIANE